MEDVGKKVHSNNPLIAGQIFSKVVEKIIRDKQKDNLKDSLELKFLKEKCFSQDFLVSDIAGISLVKLVEDKILPMEQTLAEITASINTRSYVSLINILGELIYLDYKIRNFTDANKTKKNYSRKHYNLCSPQHPFITLLMKDSECWNAVLDKIQELQDSEYFNHLLFKPVYLYCIFFPSMNSNNYLFKLKVWEYLSTARTLEKKLFHGLLCWIEIKNRDNLQLASEMLSSVLSCSSQSDHKDLFILWQTSILNELVINRLNVRPTIKCLKTSVKGKTHYVTDNSVLLMLSKVIDICSPVDLKSVLEICDILICKDSIEPYILDTIRSSLLQWLSSPCLLIEEAHRKAESIFNKIDKFRKHFPRQEDDLEQFTKDFAVEIKANNFVALSLEVFCLSKRLRGNKEVSEWLDRVLCSCPVTFLEGILNFLCGLLVNNDLSSEVLLKLFSVILKCVEKNIYLSAKVLILILYKLSNCSHPQLQFALLQALPKMVVLKDNIPKVMAALKALSKDSEDLFNVSLSLMYEAWTIDNKCYPYLETLLVIKDAPQKKWERYVAKTFVIKQLCQARPELYGKDMVAHLSGILNDCDDDDGALPSSLAIEAITILCRAGVIDIMSTWVSLLPKFKNDFRLPVVKSLCLLIKEIPGLSDDESNTEIYDDVVRKLWEYIEFGDPQISAAALDSLTAFGLEQICRHIPEVYLEEKVAPKSVAVNLVPGKTWINFLIKKGASKYAVDFIIKMISIEIDGYLKYVYQVKGPKEPSNYGYLPTHSILRAVGEFTKTWVVKSRGSIHDILYIECLKILSEEYSKPLPPLDWCFLQELMHDANTKKYCVDIASHQVVSSGTARRLIENYILAVTENFQEEDVINIFRNLKHLANSIQPVVLKPFFETTIWKAIEIHKADTKNVLLKTIFESLQTVLKHPNIQEINKTTILEVLSGVMFITDVQSDLFPFLMETIVLAPTKCSEKILKLTSDSEENWTEKIVKLKCFSARNSTISPLNWINEIVEIIKTGSNLSFWKDFQEVFKSQADNPDSALWLLDLIGQIQADVADGNDEHLRVEFDLLIAAVVHFSGYHCFLDEEKREMRMRDLFPQSLAALLARHDWDCVIQMLDWLYHMNTEEHVPSEYKQLFGLSLRALRHESEFSRNQRWMRYLNCSIDF